MERVFLSLLVTHLLRTVIRSVMNSGLNPEGPGRERGGYLIPRIGVPGLRGVRVKWRFRSPVVVFTVTSHLMVSFSKGIRVSGLGKQLPS
eukprot:6587025-Heterocapsa_arctica.AAC.1